MTFGLSINLIMIAVLIVFWFVVAWIQRREDEKRRDDLAKRMEEYTSYRVPHYYGTIDPEGHTITMQKGVDYEQV